MKFYGQRNWLPLATLDKFYFFALVLYKYCYLIYLSFLSLNLQPQNPKDRAIVLVGVHGPYFSQSVVYGVYVSAVMHVGYG